MIIHYGKKEYWLSGKAGDLIRKRLEKNLEKSNGEEIAGIIANKGKARGKAKIIINVKKEGKKMKRGDILITSMTRPEFLPLLKFAKAVVTDEGGITSHAAIISREMGIPCIIGTKYATKILHDGDLVEVDANKGIVKIL